MTTEEQIYHLENLDKKLLEIIKEKGHDYADEDVLSNFKIVSKVLKIIGIDPMVPEGYAMLMVILKIVRIWNLKNKSTEAKNEPLLDSYEDLINYAKLAYLVEFEPKVEEDAN